MCSNSNMQQVENRIMRCYDKFTKAAEQNKEPCQLYSKTVWVYLGILTSERPGFPIITFFYITKWHFTFRSFGWNALTMKPMLVYFTVMCVYICLHWSFTLLLFFLGFKCPVCSKSVASNEMEVHFIMCLSKPRLSYNGKKHLLLFFLWSIW